jgi:asparagine synthase (glutamine-hydrolysing)
MRHELKELILNVMLDPVTLQRGYFNPDGIRRLLDEHFQGRRDHSARIWRLFIFELWHRNFLESFRSRGLNQLDHATIVGGGIG